MEKISRTKIVDLLKREDFGAMVNVKGWVRTRRGSKQVNFIALNDGSTINNVQIVVDLANFDEQMLKEITTGACLSVNGVLTESVGSGQKAEIQAREIEVLGTCDNTYPLQKKGHSMEFLREIAHLRPRTNTFGAVFRIRHNMAIAIHEFFHKKGFFYFHTPIITASDCEGAGQMFQVTTMNLYDLKKDENGSIIYDDDFFGKQASLTVSGQLEGELAATALGAIYTFGPTFRAENSNTPRHLAEFWMVEPEVAFNDITDNMDLAEEFIKFCVQWALDNCADDVKFLNDMFDKGFDRAPARCTERKLRSSALYGRYQDSGRSRCTGGISLNSPYTGGSTGFRARTLFGRRPLQASGYPNGLSERNQGVLYEAERRWQNGTCYGCALPEDWRDNRRLRA